MRRNSNTLLALALLALTTLACSSSDTSNTGDGNKASTATTTNSSVIVKASTPTEASETFFNAIKQKDKDSIKKVLSRSSLAWFESEGKKRNLTLDEVFDKQVFVNITLPDKIEQRNERINGDRASVEMKSDTGEWVPTNLVREDGIWKISVGQ